MCTGTANVYMYMYVSSKGSRSSDQAKDFSILRPPITLVVKIMIEYGNEGRLVSRRRAAISINDTPPTKQTSRTGFFSLLPLPLDRARVPRLGPGFLFMAEDSSSGG